MGEIEKEEIITKPYELRRLTAKDIPLMLKILKKMNVKRFAQCFTNPEIQKLMSDISNKKETKNEEIEIDTEKQDITASVGGAVFFELMPLILDAISDCTLEVNELLASVAQTSVEEVNNLDLKIYISMILDFIKKDEFSDFIKVASKLIK